MPIKEGYEFEGWEEYPKTMPDNDITINGKYKLLCAIAQIMGDRDNACVYTTRGILIGRNMTLTEILKLPQGIYIVNGKTVVNK